MENKIKIFSNEDFGKVRTLTIDNKPYFVGKDVADILGYSNSSKALADHVDDEDKLNNESLSSLGQRGGWLINESGLYSLILSSKMPNAKKFKRWVTSEILPTIRKTGGYVANDDLFIQTYLPYADESTKSLFKVTLNTINQLNHKIEMDKPKVQFADSVANTENLIDIGTLAKLINDKYKKLGRNKLFVWLRDNGYLRHNNEPYQRYINSGIFTTREYVYNTKTGNAIGIKTYVTPKGQAYIINKVVNSLGNN